jgi:hypothetical protein
MNEKFLALAYEIERYEELLVARKKELHAVMVDLKEGSYIQDPATLVVYKIVKPNGRFVYYSDLDYKRTALPGEKGGTVLSKKEAQEAGFDLGV